LKYKMSNARGLTLERKLTQGFDDDHLRKLNDLNLSPFPVKKVSDDISLINVNETNYNEFNVNNKTNDMINRELWDLSCIEKKAD